MIRVLQYIGSLAQGGSQAMIMNIYRNIDREKLQFDFVIDSDGITELAKEAQSLGAVIYTCPKFGPKTAVSYGAWWRNFFREHREYSIIHSHVRSTAAIVLSAAKAEGLVTISHSHSTSSGSGVSALVKSVMQYPIRYIADYFMGCSQSAGEWLFGKKVCASDRYFHIPNAIDTEKYRYDLRKAEKMRSSLGFAPQDVVVGNVGRLAEPKNHGFLLEVFHRLHAMDPKYKLLLVGGGELEEPIKSRIQELNLQAAVVMTGNRQDIPELMMAMDVFCFPSKWEGLGIAAIEAQAAGLPCVASTGVPEDIRVTDLVRFRDLKDGPEAWAQEVRKLRPSQERDYVQAIAVHGYDVQASAKWIQNWYLRLFQ